MSITISIPVGHQFIPLDKVPYILASIEYEQKNEHNKIIFESAVENYKQYLLNLIKTNKVTVVYCDLHDPYKPNKDDYWNLISCLDLSINEFSKICKLLEINIFIDNVSNSKESCQVPNEKVDEVNKSDIEIYTSDRIKEIEIGALRKNAVKAADKRHERNREAKEKAIDFYLKNHENFKNKNVAAEEISKKFHKSESTVREWLKKINPKSESCE